jgi:hypothetical protein
MSIRMLLLSFVFVSGGFAIALASSEGDTDTDVDLETELGEWEQSKCCVPATPTGTAAGCPDPGCLDAVVCNMLIETGKWNHGGCQASQKETDRCQNSKSTVHKPMVQCRPVNCQLPDGAGIGKTCRWVQVGTSATATQKKVRSCNGSPCA